jgi:hypothetical protein
VPIKSKAQRRKFAQLLVEGKISPETFEEWNRGAGSAELPERLHPKRTRPKKRASTAKRKGKRPALRRKAPARKRAARAPRRLKPAR